MVKIIVSISIILVYSSIQAQEFEGKIIYASTYKTKGNNLLDSTNIMMGSIQHYYIKNGNFKVESNGTIYQWSLFINKENKYFTKVSTSDTITWTNANLYPDSIISIELNTGATEILGYRCEELILKTTKGIKKYYYNPILYTDSKNFVNYRAGSWYKFLSVANALPLRQIDEYEHYIYELNATAIIPLKLHTSFFQLQPGCKLKESEKVE